MHILTRLTIKATLMDERALYRLMTWLSPSFPVGAFAYSHGIEWAVEDGRITDIETLNCWISDVVQVGGGWSDAVLFSNAYDAGDDQNALVELNALACAMAPSSERYLEITAQGNAFVKAVLNAWAWDNAQAMCATLKPDVAYPVIVAMAARGHGIQKDLALHAFIHASAANLVSAGVRLIPLGQSAGQHVMVKIEHAIESVTKAAGTADISKIGGVAFLSDIAAMQHEIQYTRLFRS